MATQALTKPAKSVEWTPREWAAIANLAESRSPTEACRKAGYKNPGESASKLIRKLRKYPLEMIREGMEQRGLNPVVIGQRIADFAFGDGKVAFHATMSAAALYGANTRASGADSNRSPMQVKGEYVQIIVNPEDKDSLTKMLKSDEAA